MFCVLAPTPLPRSDRRCSEEEYELYTLRNEKSKPFEVDLLLDGQPITMEIDTGASRSVIPWKLYLAKFKSKPLQSSSVRLKTYDGQLLVVKGSISVEVVHGRSKATQS